MADDATTFVQRMIPLCSTLGITSHQLEPSAVTLAIEWSAELCTGSGVMHGGIVMALADSAGATCAYLNLPESSSTTATIESKTNFIRPVTSGTVAATARPLHVGSTTIVVETDVRDSDDRLVARTTQTQAVL
jgi:uncharacterized protein (TIGR00369 family)